MNKTKQVIAAATEAFERELSGIKSRPTSIVFSSIADLSDALLRAKTAHAEFERGLGHPDHNWPLWYAAYIAMEQGMVERPVCKLATTAINVVREGPEAFITPQTKSPGDFPAHTQPNHSDSGWGFGADDGSAMSDEEYWAAHE